VPIAEGVGCRKDQIAALEAGTFDASCFDEREKTLLAFSREVIRDVKASEAAVKAMQKHFSSQEIVEVILTCGFYMTMARLTETTRTDIDAPGGMAVLNELGRMG
jgi:alkylhydroperoxidase family enzyme